jgi:hypothetical protein
VYEQVIVLHCLRVKKYSSLAPVPPFPPRVSENNSMGVTFSEPQISKRRTTSVTSFQLLRFLCCSIHVPMVKRRVNWRHRQVTNKKGGIFVILCLPRRTRVKEDPGMMVYGSAHAKGGTVKDNAT